MRTLPILAVCLVLAGCATTTPTVQAKEQVKAAPVVDLVGVAADAADNPLAIEKYKGTIYRVTGELLAISRMTKPSNEIIALFNQGTDFGGYPVIGVAVFPDSQFAVLSELKVGERITIEGAFYDAKYRNQYKRESWNVTFNQCKLID